MLVGSEGLGKQVKEVKVKTLYGISPGRGEGMGWEDGGAQGGKEMRHGFMSVEKEMNRAGVKRIWGQNTGEMSNRVTAGR